MPSDEINSRRSRLSPAKQALLEQRLRGKPSSESQTEWIPRRSPDDPMPLSFAQQRLWFLDQLALGSALYNMPAAVRFTGHLETGALQNAIGIIIQRHQVLRTTFQLSDGELRQSIAPELRIELPIVELAATNGKNGVGHGDLDGLITARIVQEAQQPFDLVQGPLIRATLLRLNEQDYILVLCLHHIVADGWSLGVFVTELTALYRNEVERKPAQLTELPIQYSDFALWQQQQGSLIESQVAYWKQQLAGAPTALELPMDKPRPPVQRFHGARKEFVLPQELTAKLKALCHQEGVTLFQTLLAAFQTLLLRYTEQRDMVVGTLIANRTRPEIEGLIGCFANTLVLRTDMSGNPTVHELLQRVRQVTLDAYEHQDVPFEQVVDALQLQRDLSRNPLFQALFVLQNAPMGDLHLPGLVLRPITVDHELVRFDLALTMAETSDGLKGTWGYSTDLFESATIQRLLEQYHRLLEGMVSGGVEQQLSALPLLSQQERQLFAEWNATRTHYPQADECLHTLVEAQAARTPDAIALISDDCQITYGELNRRADQLASYLHSLGVDLEARVGLCLERSIELVIGLLGIFKAGGAYVPLDPDYPTERLAYMLADAQVSVILVHAPTLPLLATDELQRACQETTTQKPIMLNLDSEWEAISQQSAERSGVATTVTADHLAYVIYTSGSTGRPKGVQVSHRAIVNRLLWAQATYPLGAADSIIQVAAVGFDIALWELAGPLLAGARVVLARPGGQREPAYLVELLVQQQVTVAHFVPALLQVLFGQPAIKELTALRLLFCGGDRLPADLPEQCEQHLPWAALHQFYGPTEAAISATSWPCHAHEPGATGATAGVPIGRPIANMTVSLLDAAQQPVPIGAIGEVYLGGVGLARGYQGKSTETAEHFVPDPLSRQAGARLYRTGDLARYRVDGVLEYLGRNDDQIKLRGYRIEPGEIEAVLRRHESVQDCAVVVQGSDGRSNGTANEKRLLAFVALSELPNVTTGELRQFLRAALPDYMIPAAIVPLLSLPLTPNGKVDRRTLQAFDALPSVESDQVFVEPRTALERFLATTWQKTLKVERLSTHENFFDLGGDSIKAAICMNKVQEAFGALVYVVALFDAPTIADLAAYLGEHYPEIVRQHFGVASLSTSSALATSAQFAPITDIQIYAMRQLIPPLVPRTVSRPKNPPAVFVLSPPRSGSTLLRVMLAGHPALFAPPELELLSFNTLAERKAAFAGRDRFWLEGTIRAIMEIKGCDAATAQRLMEEYEAQNLSAQQFYGLMQQWLGTRLLVDKTPAYALDSQILQRMEDNFAETHYIYLLRQPYGMIRSFEEARLDQVFFRYKHPFSTRELAELIWLTSHQNIGAFLQRIPRQRQHWVVFEDLLRTPEPVLRGICEFLGLAFESAMLDPYQGRRMTDGIHAISKMVGDVKFHTHTAIDPAVADQWKQRSIQDPLAEITWQMAEQLGYERLEQQTLTTAIPATSTLLMPIQPVVRGADEPLPLSFAQERLWFLDQLTPGTATYNIPAAIRLSGVLDVSAFNRSLQDICSRHESLRTTFETLDGGPVQVIHPPTPFALPMIDLSYLGEDEREAEANCLALQEARRPFDLADGPLLRGFLPRLSANEHALLLTLHHIVADGWSIGVLVRELVALYRARVEQAEQGTALLPGLPIQYADFAIWQRSWLHGPLLDQQFAYWKEQLEGSPTILDFPLDHPRSAVQTSHGAQQTFVLPPNLLEQLKELSKHEGTTLFMTLLAGFQTLLWRYTGQDDIVIGTPVANRMRTELEHLIGFFVNTLPLRVQMSDDLTFHGLLQQVREVTLGAYRHQDLPFERLIDELQLVRRLSYTPLFQVVFALQNAPVTPLRLPGLSITPIETGSSTAKYDLTVLLEERGQQVQGVIEYNTDLFYPETVMRLAEHFQTLLESIVAQPQQRLSQLALLTPAEHQLLLGEWSQPHPAAKGAEDTAQTLAQRFEAQVACNPEAEAVRYEQATLTYRELNARANPLAHQLQALGVGPDVLVGLCIERSLDLVVGILAILKAGGAYVPLDSDYPAERLAFMLNDSAAPILLTHSSLLERLSNTANTAAQVVCIDAQTTQQAQWPTANPTNRTVVTNAAYVIYTSGSTGQPKGVVIPQWQVLRLLEQTEQWYHFGPQDVWTLFHSYAFDFSVWELWGALLYGGRLVVVPYLVSRNPEAFYHLLFDEQVTVLNQTPSAFRQLSATEEALFSTAHPGATGTSLALRYVIFGGEALDLESLGPWFSRHGDQQPQLVNMYGITETTVHVTYRPIAQADVEASRGSVIGHPISDLRLYVLDSHQQLVPIGVPGELHVGGAGLARGYLNRPELTAQRFVPDSFSSMPGARRYRTGDLVRYLSDGELEYLGRIDQQVKIRGHRIELGEIETALVTHPAVQECLVVAHAEQASAAVGEQRLVAYVVPQTDGATRSVPSAAALRQYLQRTLPEYMVPSAFVLLEALPLTPSGKVNRRALPAPGGARPDIGAIYTAPRTPVEEALAGIWAHVLEVEQVGIHDDYFALGGDSIRSVRVLTLARAQGQHFTLQQLFQHQTIAELAQVITTESIDSTLEQPQPFSMLAPEECLKLPVEVEDAYPLTRLQAGMLFHSAYEESNAGSIFYHNVTSLRVQATYDAAGLDFAAQQLAARHAVLRTSFDLSSYSQPLQLVHRQVAISMQTEDLRALSLDERDAQLVASLEQEKHHAFDYTHAPLLRFLVQRCSDDTFQFTLTEHHAILDGWSVASLLAEFFQTYLAFLQHEPVVPAPAPETNFSDFVALEREVMQSVEAEHYWKEKLQGCQALHLFGRRTPATITQAAPPRFLDVAISPETSAGLKRLARRTIVPLKSVLLAAHLRVLSLLSGERDVLTGLVTNGRPETPGGEEVLGLFLNTLPFRQRLRNGTWVDLVRETFSSEWELLPYRRYPLAEIQRLSGERTLFEAAFNFVHFHVLETLGAAEALKIQGTEGFAQTNFALAVDFSLSVRTSQVEAHLECNDASITDEQFAAIGEYYASTLATMADTPDQRYELVRLLPEQEYQTLLAWRGSISAGTTPLLVHEQFAEQAARTPDAMALVLNDQHLTYAELNQRTNQLAQVLLAHNIMPESLVGVCLERSPALIVALLGILKAGGAYLPLDPNYPTERLAYMLADAQVNLVLTQTSLLDRLPVPASQMLSLERDWIPTKEHGAEIPLRAVLPEQLAYVLYTSGSTGTPKGVMVQHSALTRFVAEASQAYGLNARDRVLQFASVNFDTSAEEIYPCLCSGATLVLRTEAMLASVPAFLAVCADQGITVLDLPTAYWQEVSNALEAERLPAPAALRLLIVGGELALSRYLSAWQYRQTNSPRLVNTYGVTEATVVSTTYDLTYDFAGSPDFAAAGNPSLPIGRTLPHAQVYVLDAAMEMVPIGVIGELYLGGAGVARGYLQRPELTAERFVPDPFSNIPGARLYRTSDLARFDASGVLEFVRRGDQQVKVRGYRIEPGEIEAALHAYPLIQAAAVVARVDRAQSKQLVAYIVPSENRPIGVAELRAYLLGRLPDYMIPAIWMELSALPLTPNGKVDRRHLPAPDEERPTLETRYITPQTAVETTLSAIWQQVLGLAQIGTHDNFFELGGDSILSIQIVARATQQGLRLTPKQIFEYQTIQRLAAVLDTTFAPASTAQQDSVIGSVPLTPIQQWFFEQERTERQQFVQAMLLEVQQSLDFTLLAAAFEQLLSHHDALRMRFTQDGATWLQDNAGPSEQSEIPFVRFDFSQLGEVEQDQALAARITELPASLDLSNGPLSCMAVFDLGPQRPACVYWCIHHLMVDGVSWRVLLEDLESVYMQLQRGEAVQLPPKTTSFQQWAYTMQAHAQAPVLTQEAYYWLKLSQAKFAPLPRDYSDGANTLASARQITVSLSADETRSLLLDVPSAYHTQINEILLTALVQTISQWTGKRSLLVAMEGHGREHLADDIDLSRTVGWFTSMYPLRLDLTTAIGSGSLGVAIKTIKEQVRQVPKHGIGYGILRYLSPDAEKVKHLRDVQEPEIIFNYLGQFDQMVSKQCLFALAHEAEDNSPGLAGPRSHLLDVHGFVADGQLEITWIYGEKVHQRETIEQLAQNYLIALRQLIAHCLSPDAGGYTPADFPLAYLDPQALDRILASSHETEDLYSLTPLQEGMLFHTLYAPNSGTYIGQVCCELEGELDVNLFQRAWQQVVDNYTVLRTAFVWDGLETPLQIVQQHVRVPMLSEIWCSVPPAQQRLQLHAYMLGERTRGFDLTQAPLMRLGIFQVDDERSYFVWSHHHLLLDGWSIALVLGTVFASYEALLHGRPPISQSPHQYRDYIAWLRQQDTGRAETFWSQQLRGFTTPTPLLADRQVKHEIGEITAAQEEVHLSAATTFALQSLARQVQVTINTLLQGAWALLLSRYSGDEDVVYGTTVSGRPADLPGVETMVGMFINTLPVRVKVTPHMTLLSWLQEVQMHLTELQQYEYSSLVQIQGWGEVPRDQRLFDSILVVENYPVNASLRQEERSLRLRATQSFDQTDYPLTVIATPEAECVLQITYDRARFDEQTIQRMLGHLQTLLEGMLHLDSEQSIAGLPLLSTAEQHRLLVEWNATQVDYPGDVGIHVLFENQARRTPDAVALVYQDTQLTYGELNRQANRLAVRLRQLDVGPEVAVGLCLERSLEMVIGILGILKAGGTYIPLDPAYPRERLAYMVEDANVRLLLVQEAFRDVIPFPASQIVLLDSNWEAADDGSGEEPGDVETSTTGDHLAYVMYTSGSTGQPKGVEIRHRSIARLVFGVDYARLDADQTLLHLAPISFDASTLELWGALLHGARCVLLPSRVPTAQEIGEVIATQGVTAAWLTASLFNAIIDEMPGALQCLDQLLTGGEALSVAHIQRALNLLTRTHLTNGYGPTESTTFTCCYPINAEAMKGGTPRSIPIGRPIGNTEVYLLDAQLSPVPVGVAGELYIGGAGLARGYRSRPDLTAERFIPNPFSKTPGTRLYRTGDLARYLPDGAIEFLGRIDQQVKIRGFRIEPGEIEATLRRHPSLSDCCIVVKEPGQDAHQEKRLIAYIVPIGHPSPIAAELRHFLQNYLPDYMVPTTFVELAALPLTPNGKVDHRALPEPGSSSMQSEAAFAAPRTPVEELLATIWTALLQVDNIGMHDNFFELGGHSLLATRVVSRIREVFGIELPLRTLFETPTIADLAVAIVEAQQETLEQPVPLVAVPRTTAPLSFAQQRLWFLDQFEPNNAFYNIPTAIRLEGELQMSVLYRCFSELVRRHDTLRTRFLAQQGQPVQVILSEEQLLREQLHLVDLPLVDLSQMPAARQEQLVRQLAHQEAERPFDLEHDPLLRLWLLRLGATEHVLLLTMHHIISDGWSVGVLHRELTTLYQAFSAGEASPLPPLPLHYADYAVWQREYLQGERLERQLHYWRNQLADAPTLIELPTDYSRPALQSFRGAQITHIFSQALAADLRRLDQELGATLYMSLLAAFQVLLARLSDQQEIVVGTPIANRTRSEIEGLLGFFVNTLVIRTDLAGDPTCAEVVRRVRETCLAAYAHQEVPLEQVVEAVQPARTLSHNPLFQVMFALQNTPEERLQLEGLTLQPLVVESETVQTDLALTLIEADDGLHGALAYNTDLFTEATIRRLLAQYERLLQGIVANPTQRISQVPLLNAAERQQIIEAWNDTYVSTDITRKCLHELVEERAARTPDAIAWVFEEQTLTYADFNQRANQLAHLLRARGIGREELVGVCLERSPELLIGVLGILKAGGAYVPLDPSYPTDRLSFMLTDAQVKLVLTQKMLLDQVPALTTVPVLCLDAEATQTQLGTLPIENLALPALPAQLAYVLYTSGSTGTPKPVGCAHAGVLNLLDDFQRRSPLTATDRGSLWTSLSFDVSIYELFSTLLAGGTLHLVPERLRAESHPFFDWLAAQRITSAYLPPFMLASFADYLREQDQHAPLKRLLVGVEPIQQRVLAEIQVSLPQVQIINGYGPTEATICSTLYSIPGNEEAMGEGIVPIGRPVQNTQVYILNQVMEPTPIGVAGELYIGGMGLARGYLGRPEATAERFVPNPFSTSPGARLYRTGDQARYCPDGNIVFQGRRDTQIKLHGFRIELGEIEAALAQHTEVQQAAAVLQSLARPASTTTSTDQRQEVAGERVLVAYVVLQEDHQTTPAALRSYLQERLPHHMIPAVVIELAALPLSPNGKVDRRALPAVDRTQHAAEAAQALPRTATEEQLATVWKNVLGLAQVGIYDDFFALGGHSLLATQVISRVRELFHVEVPLRSLFEKSTIAALAEVIVGYEGSEGEESVPALAPVSRAARRIKLPTPDSGVNENGGR